MADIYRYKVHIILSRTPDTSYLQRSVSQPHLERRYNRSLVISSSLCVLRMGRILLRQHCLRRWTYTVSYYWTRARRALSSPFRTRRSIHRPTTCQNENNHVVRVQVLCVMAMIPWNPKIYSVSSVEISPHRPVLDFFLSKADLAVWICGEPSSLSNTIKLIDICSSVRNMWKDIMLVISMNSILPPFAKFWIMVTHPCVDIYKIFWFEPMPLLL